MWPPKRPFAGNARSRFTSDPALSAPRLVTFAVSGPISAEKAPAVLSTTVRHTPLTEMLSPRRRSPAMSVEIRRLKPASIGFTSPTLPTASINPVNITFHEDVWTEWRHATIDKRGHRDSIDVEPRHSFLTERHRRDIQMNGVDEPGLPGRCLQ